MNFTRRSFLRDLALPAAAVPFLGGLPSLHAHSLGGIRKQQRLVIVFSPNGTIPEEFWPGIGEDNRPEFKRILKPLDAFKDQTLVLRGISNKVKGDGDSHMRGMSCLLTATELFPGNIQGGSDSPAGWASGISIDQEISKALQRNEATKTRFGSLEFGVAVPDRADPWTRMSYAGPNKPLAPISDPELMLGRLYGDNRNDASILGIVDSIKNDLTRVSKRLSPEDRLMLEEHMTLVSEMQAKLLQSSNDDVLDHYVPEIDPDVELVNDNTPQLSQMQMDLLVNSLTNNMTKVATLQFMRSVGQARMGWLGVDEGHHGLSHEPDGNEDSREKLIRINIWFAEQIAYLAVKLRDTPEPGGGGDSMLDNTLIVWINELGKGNSHTLEDLPFVMLGGAPNIQFGRSLDFATFPEDQPDKRDRVTHNRLWLSLAQSMGHDLPQFGTEALCGGGALDLS